MFLHLSQINFLQSENRSFFLNPETVSGDVYITLLPDPAKKLRNQLRNKMLVFD